MEVTGKRKMFWNCWKVSSSGSAVALRGSAGLSVGTEASGFLLRLDQGFDSTISLLAVSSGVGVLQQGNQMMKKFPQLHPEIFPRLSGAISRLMLLTARPVCSVNPRNHWNQRLEASLASPTPDSI